MHNDPAKFKLVALVALQLMLGHLNASAQSVDFTDGSEDFGLVFQTNGEAIFGTGISFFDFNQDGYDDITITGSMANEPWFFVSTGDSLEPVDMQVDLTTNYTTSILWADFDNDNDLDISATHDGGPIKLFENIGGNEFSQIGISGGISDVTISSFAGAWSDYDLDGDIDFYASNRVEIGISGNRNVLYQNLGNNQFLDVTDVAMVADSQGIGYGVVFTDIDKDGYPDLYVANDKFINRNTLYRNLGNGIFEDVSETSGTDFFIDGMGIAPGDIDGDGFEEMYITNTAQSSFDFGGNLFLFNDGIGNFTDEAENLNMRVFKLGWGCSFGDFNNDGHLDLFVANESEGPADHNVLFFNNGNGTFTEDTVSPIYYTYGSSFGSALGDVNDDGHLDITTVNYNPAEVKLWVNEGSENNWVKFTLEGTVSNRQAIGTWVEVYTNGVAQYRYKRCGISYCSQDGRAVHFGLGSSSIVDSVKVIWPTMESETFYNLGVNVTHHIVENPLVTDIESFLGESLNLYPNPTTIATQVKWESTTSENSSIEVINMAGQIVKTWSLPSIVGHNQTILSLEGIAPGLYCLNLSVGNLKKWSQRLVVR